MRSPGSSHPAPLPTVSETPPSPGTPRPAPCRGGGSKGVGGCCRQGCTEPCPRCLSTGRFPCTGGWFWGHIPPDLRVTHHHGSSTVSQCVCGDKQPQAAANPGTAALPGPRWGRGALLCQHKRCTRSPPGTPTAAAPSQHGGDTCPHPAGGPCHHPMFRSRRAGLVRRLWRQRCAAASPEDSPGALKPAAHALFKKLKDEELELLVQAVESRGAWESGCVWAPRGELRGAKQALPPQVLLCRLYRWPDLRQPHELKHLCYCTRGRGGCGDTAALCCNPHHFSRLAAPGECRRLHQSPSSPTHSPTSGVWGQLRTPGGGRSPTPHPLLSPPRDPSTPLLEGILRSLLAGRAPAPRHPVHGVQLQRWGLAW